MNPAVLEEPAVNWEYDCRLRSFASSFFIPIQYLFTMIRLIINFGGLYEGFPMHWVYFIPE